MTDISHIAEAERIEGRLRAAQTVDEVESVADDERVAVKAMSEASPEARALAIQISNLKMYRINDLKRGQ